MTNLQNLPFQALMIADVLAGRPLPEGFSLDAEIARAQADEFFVGIGVVDHAAYMSFRSGMKAQLRELAGEIRDVKAKMRFLDGNDAEFWDARSNRHRLHVAFARAHNARRLGKAWSALKYRERAANAA